MYQISWHISLAEHEAVKLLRTIDPDAKIGPVCAIQVVYPYSSDPLDVTAAMNAEEMMEFDLLDLSVRGQCSPYAANWLKAHDFMPEKEENDDVIMHESKPDFIGINYYFSVCAKHTDKMNYDLPPFWVSDSYEIIANPKLEKTEWMNMGIDPQGLYIRMRKVYERYGLAMIVTENGMAYSEHLDREGYSVFGYCPWSFMDVVSSHQGFSKRYGFVYIDRTETDVKQYKRVKKDSFDWYRKVIEQNGL